MDPVSKQKKHRQQKCSIISTLYMMQMNFDEMKSRNMESRTKHYNNAQNSTEELHRMVTNE